MYNRYIIPPIIEALRDTPVVVLNGARQTGKSTLCGQLLNQGIFQAKYITLDDPSTLSAAQTDPLGFLEDLGKHVMIDEIQKVPELLVGIKKLVDQDRTGRRLILTGSADVMTMPKVSESLAGRIEIHNLWPLSQDEILGKPSTFLETLVSEKKFQNNKN